jgi:multiple antibiotic resistance protein
MDFALSAFAAIFAIVNPVGNLTFFVALTEGYTLEDKKRVIKKAILVASATLLIFALAGNYIFAIFHTSIPAFRIAGGLLIPMFAGPGSITTVMVYMAEASSPDLDAVKIGIILLAIIATMAVSYLLLRYSGRITRRMGRTGAAAFSRVMGLILAAIAVQIIVIGIFGVIDLYYLR